MQRQPLAVIQDPGASSGDTQHAMQYSSLQATYQSSGRTRMTPAPNNTTLGGGSQQVIISPTPVQQSQRLKVEDALTYLDQVKLMFSTQPQVYNDFLDIMKEFKSQSIDTPGVIQRVSNLFKGHTPLIIGFNTFLPPGYKIEVLANNEISVSMPPNIASQPPVTPVSKPAPNNNVVPVTTANSVAPTPPAAPPAPRCPPPPASESPSAPSPQPRSPLPSQPVEFNHAINYVNKIKNRFQGQPDVYKQFLEILHTYQKEQRSVKEVGQQKALTESEVYLQVASLFQNQADLLAEFGQFLPDANGGSSNQLVSLAQPQAAPPPTTPAPTEAAPTPISTPKKIHQYHHHHHHHKPLNSSSSKSLKRSSGASGISSASKKMKMTSLEDVSLAEAGKCGTLSEFAFFDKVHAHLKCKEDYENFIRCIILYNQEIISRGELLKMVTPFLCKSADLHKWFKDFLGLKEVPPSEQTTKMHERLGGEFASMEIDYSSCKKYGTSYRALPKNFVQPKCSGRNALCKEVLNDTWVSFPSWSEDSTFVTSKKTPYEESIYRCEDERFELDVVIEINSACIRSLEALSKKLIRMSSEEKSRFHLDDTLGSTSSVINKQAISRIYGDKAPDVIEGLKKNPAVAVPIVLRRLKEKEEEWKSAQRSFNKVWREQNEKFYLKSLDHQGLTFKQTDAKYIRSKHLLNEIENMFEERQDNGEEETGGGPHLALYYKDKSILDDAANLIIHHVKRQTSINKDDKHKIKVLLRHFIPDLFSTPRGILSDDEMEVEDEPNTNTHLEEPVCPPDSKGSELLQFPLQNNLHDDNYALFMVNSHWYLFFRLHNILCERLIKIYNKAMIIAAEEAKEKKHRDIAVSESLRLKTKSEYDVEEYYPVFLDQVKSLLDNNIDGGQYEDNLRDMFGIHAFVAFTLDKVVQNAVRHLQNIVSSSTTGLQCRDLFLQEQRNGATGGPCAAAPTWAVAESSYQRKAETLLCEESCYKIILYKKEGKMCIEMLESFSENSEYDQTDSWNTFVEDYCRSHNVVEEVKEVFCRKKPLLLRNIKNVKDSMKKTTDETPTMVLNPTLFHRMGFANKARKTHRSVSLKKRFRFQSWLREWANEHVSKEKEQALKTWFLEGNVQCKQIEPSEHIAPYDLYSRYLSAANL